MEFDDYFSFGSDDFPFGFDCFNETSKDDGEKGTTNKSPKMKPDFFCEDAPELPFEIDEDDGYHANSPYQYLYYAYSCLATCDFIEAMCWCAEGYKRYPDNPDILAFFTISNLKIHNALKGSIPEEHNDNLKYKDWHGEKLIEMDRGNDEFSIRAYVALILYLIETDPDANKKTLELLVNEMRNKYSCDLSGHMAELLFQKTFSEDSLPDQEVYQIQIALIGLRSCMDIEDCFSGYISSILPLFEAFCDELYWPWMKENN